MVMNVKTQLHIVLTTVCLLVLIAMHPLAAQELSGGETTLATGFRQANQAYSEGRYSEALQGYRDLLERSGPSAELYYNAGCAALKAGELGQAAVSFHRAARLDPRDPDIRANLEFVREFVGSGEDGEAEENVFFSFVSGLIFSLTTREVSILQLLFLLVFSLGAVAVAAGQTGSLRKLSVVLAAGGLVLLMANSAVLAAHIYRYHHVSEAVVVQDDAEALSGPGEENTRVLVIPEATVVRVREQRGDWALVSLPSGRSGWLKISLVEII